MVRTLIFDKSKKKIDAYDEYVFKGNQKDIVWTHLVSNEDKVIDLIMDDFGHDESFEQDFLEDQRPRLTCYDNTTVAVIGAPVRAIMTMDDPDGGVIQVSFILKKNKLISVSDRKSIIIDNLMDSYSRLKYFEASPGLLFSKIFEAIIENVIKVIELLEKKVDSIQSRIIQGEDLKGIITQVEEIKENLYYTQKILRADIEVVREILFGKTDMISVEEFHSHIEDRLLYALDIVDVARHMLDGVNSLYMAAISNKMNEHVYKLTLLGSIMFVPAVIASFWGMNVELPLHNFWIIILFSMMLSLVLFLWLKFSRIKL